MVEYETVAQVNWAQISFLSLLLCACIETLVRVPSSVGIMLLRPSNKGIFLGVVSISKSVTLLD